MCFEVADYMVTPANDLKKKLEDQFKTDVESIDKKIDEALDNATHTRKFPVKIESPGFPNEAVQTALIKRLHEAGYSAEYKKDEDTLYVNLRS